MVMGRPQKYDRIKEAEDLIKWAKLPDSLNLIKFTLEKEYTYEMMLQWVRDDVDFSQAYEKARELLSFRREEAVNKGKFNPRIYDRWATIYDKQLDAHEDDKVKRRVEMEVAVKKAEMKTVTDEAIELNKAIVKGISELQEARKIEDINSKSDK